MTRWGAQRIESYDLARAAAEASCYICSVDNSTANELCRKCGAPMALAYHQKKSAPRMIGVVGTPGAGKTSYMGMLTDILSRQQSSIQILARGAFSVTLQQLSIDALAQRRFPQRTSLEPLDWNWVHCELSGLPRQKTVDLVLPDVAGDTFFSELDQPGSVQVIREFLRKCSAAVLLVDTDRVELGDQGADFAAMKIISYLAELAPDRKRGWGQRPVAVVFTKADRSVACFDQPDVYCQQGTPGLWRQCQERLNKHRFFAATLTGGTVEATVCGDRLRVPLRIEPRGVTEPMEWLVDQLAL